MIHLTKPDATWLLKLLIVVEENHEDYPELFTKSQEETLLVAGQLIRNINQ
jgi:hypothetical protein